MKSKSAEIYVFSGTGNTFSVVQSICAILNDNNCPTILRPIPGAFLPAKNDCALGLAFPTACFSTYPFVLDFIKNIPPTTNDREVFLISTMATNSFGMPQPIRKLLIEKGYRPIGVCLLKMPSNYGKHANAKTRASQKIISDAYFQATNFAGQMLIGKTSWEKSSPIFATQLYKFAQKNFIWKLFRNLFTLKIDQNLCIKCGFCKNICPYAAIEKVNENYNISTQCVSCHHCAAFCPESAIGIGSVPFAPYRLVEYKEMSTKSKSSQ